MNTNNPAAMIRRTAIVIVATLLSIATLSAQQIVAHRGHHSVEGSAENSLASLHAAHSAGINIVEFDVVFTADGRAVVAHGPNHPKSGGEPINKTRFEALRSTPLENGECLPTLEEYLAVAKEYPEIELLLEIKLLGKESEEEVFATIDSTVERYGLIDRVTYISFSKRICDLARERGSMYLMGDLSPRKVAKRGYKGISYPAAILRLHPAWIKRAQRLGLKVSIWTVNQTNGVEWAIRHGVDYITTDNPALVAECIANSKTNNK